MGDRDGEEDIYNSDSGGGELHPNVCCFTARLHNSQERTNTLVLRICRYHSQVVLQVGECLCTGNIRESHTGEAL